MNTLGQQSDQGHFEADVMAVLWPRCEACERPHPRVLGVPCLCGAALRPPRYHYEAAAVMGAPEVPLHAKVLLKIGAWIRTMASRL